MPKLCAMLGLCARVMCRGYVPLGHYYYVPGAFTILGLSAVIVSPANRAHSMPISTFSVFRGKQKLSKTRRESYV